MHRLYNNDITAHRGEKNQDLSLVNLRLSMHSGKCLPAIAGGMSVKATAKDPLDLSCLRQMSLHLKYIIFTLHSWGILNMHKNLMFR